MGDSKNNDDAVAAELQAALQGPRRGRDAIDALIPLLSPWELIYLRGRTRDIHVDAISSNGFATCLDLPMDILVLILDHLGRHDLLVLRRVSRAWNRLWMQGDVLRTVLWNHFPGLLQLHPGEQDLEHLFLNIMNRYRCKPQGKLGSATVFWDILGNLPSSFTLSTSLVGRYRSNPEPRRIYSSGKVVWKPASGEIVIDDLRSGTRTRCPTFPDPRRRNDYGDPVALTETLVVLSTAPNLTQTFYAFSAPRALHIYHLEHKTWKHISLPAEPASCYANGETVIATCYNGQTLIWSWDATLEVLPTDHKVYNALPSQSGRLFDGKPGALFHPHKSQVVYLSWVFSNRPKIDPESSLHSSPKDSGFLSVGVDLRTSLPSAAETSPPLYTTVVVRYERKVNRGWAASARFEHTVHYPEINSEFSHAAQSASISPRASLTLSCEKADNHGSYNIVTCRPVRMSWVSEYPGPCWLNAIAQCFNVLTETFFQISYPDVGYASMIGVQCDRGSLCVRLWNRKVFQIHGLTGGNLTDDLGFRPFDHSCHLKAECDRIDALGVVWNCSTVGHHEIFDCGKEPMSFLAGPYELSVDDEFIIISTPQGYFVRSFHPSCTSDWLSKADGNPPKYIEGSHTSSMSRPPGLMVLDRTDLISLYEEGTRSNS